MNLVVYLVLWVAIGLFAGVVANWIFGAGAWRSYVVDLLIGVVGAVAAAYFLLNALFGMNTILSAFSIVMAILGASTCLFISGLIRKAWKNK